MINHKRFYKHLVTNFFKKNYPKYGIPKVKRILILGGESLYKRHADTIWLARPFASLTVREIISSGKVEE